VLAHAKNIVDSSEIGMTLRKLFYKLVGDQTLPNTGSCYKTLSHYTAVGRRNGTFPKLLDRGRWIIRPTEFSSARAALAWLTRVYAHDHDTNQTHSLYLGVEKAGIETLLEHWVNAMLLNEFLKAHRKLDQQQAMVDRQQKQIEALTSIVQKVSDQITLSKPALQLVANP
jgi:hypothetical protein